MEQHYPEHVSLDSIPDEATVMSSLTHPLKRWIEEELKQLNELQLVSIPNIQNQNSTLIFAPTGSGKTLAAFLGIIDKLYQKALSGKLEERIYAVYVSPLRALNNDIQKNLLQPLESIKKHLPESVTHLRSQVRTGDTPSAEKSKMLKSPPHILITTPESLGIALASSKFSKHLSKIEWLIIDEIHALAGDKRGAFLSLVVEWLELACKNTFARIGLSATISPINTIANFLMGIHEEKRTIHIIDYGTRKLIDLEILIPQSELGYVFATNAHSHQVKLVEHLIKQNETTIVFANTRHWSERTVRDLIELNPTLTDKIAVHHGSLDRDVRYEIENKMKAGKLKAIVTSASLELGIDIGSINLAIQVNSGKSVNRTLQRIGRAGHIFKATSTGKLIVGSKDDLLEQCAIAKLMLQGKLDEIYIPVNPLDVLAQIIVGLTIHQNWKVSNAYRIIKQSYNFHTLSLTEFKRIITSMSNPLSEEENWKYGRIWYEPELNEFGRKRFQRQNFMMNIGTIPEVASFAVHLEGTRTKIGNISESFAEKLGESDIFMLGGKSYLFLRTIGNKIIVRDSYGSLPTIPNWHGEPMSRTQNVSTEISNILEKFDRTLNQAFEETAKKTATKAQITKNKEKELLAWLTKNYPLSLDAATELYKYLNQQNTITSLPTIKKLILEKYEDPIGRTVLIVLSIFGLKINRPLADAYAKALSNTVKASVGTTVSDNGFALILPPGYSYDLRELLLLIKTPEEFYVHLDKAIMDTQLFQSRFKYVACRGLMVLKKSIYRNLNVDQVQRSALKLIRELPTDFPLLHETKREILEDEFNAKGAAEVIVSINSSRIEIYCKPIQQEPSPMTHSIILSSVSDIILLEDQQNLMLNLYQQVLQKLENDPSRALFDPKVIQDYFQQKLTNTELFTVEERIISYLSIQDDRSFQELVKNCAKSVSVEESVVKKFFSQAKNVYSISGRFILEEELLTWLQEVEDRSELLDSMKLISGKKLDNKQELLDVVHTSSPETLLGNLIMKVLAVTGPLSLNELIERLKRQNKRVEETVWELQRRNLLLGGEFTSPERQFMNYADRQSFVIKHNTENHYSLNQLNFLKFKRLHLLEKLSIGSNYQIGKLFTLIAPARNVLEIYNRVENFSWNQLRIAMQNEEIFFGKFHANRLGFIPRELLELFINIYRENIELSPIHTTILEFIRTYDSLTYTDLLKKTSIERNIFKESLEFLERQLYISRTGWEIGSVTSQLGSIHYRILPEITVNSDKRPDYILQLLPLIIKWYGPVTVQDLLRISKLKYTEIERALQSLEKKKRLIFAPIFSNEFLYYGFPDDFDKLNATNFDPKYPGKVNLLSASDSYFYSRGTGTVSAFYSKFETLYITYKGINVGSISLSINKDYLQVVNVLIKSAQLEDRDFLLQLNNELSNVSKAVFNLNSIVIEEIRGLSPNFSKNSVFTYIFTKHGYQLVVDRLVGGTSLSSLAFSDIIKAKLLSIFKHRKQNLELLPLIENLGKVSVEKIANLLNLSHAHVELKLHALISQSEIFYRNGELFSKESWNNLVEDSEELTSLEIKILQKIEANENNSITLAKSFKLTDTSVDKILKGLAERNLIDLKNPFIKSVKWRRSERVPNTKEDIYNKLFLTIKWFGPLSYQDLIQHYSTFKAYRKFFLLAQISQLLDEQKIDSVWVGSSYNTVFYFDPAMKKEISSIKLSSFPHWMIVNTTELPLKELLNLSDLFFSTITHAIFEYGEVVATLKLSEMKETLVVEKINLDTSLTEQKMLTLIEELEGFMFQQGYSALEVKHIYDNSPMFWIKETVL